MTNLVPLASHTEDYGYIEYELQLQLNAPKLKISECYLLKNPHVEASFMNYLKTLKPSNVVDVFVPLSQIEQTQSDIASKGIKVNPQSGFRFKVGTFDVDRSKDVIEVVRLTVALGNTLNFQSQSSDLDHASFASDSPTSSALRAGYHSLCVSDEGDYVVFNSAQIKTCQLVKFHGGEDLEELKEEGDICEACGEAPAVVWCQNDNAMFCEKCDQEAHKSHIASKHKRMTLAEARALMEYCPFHKDTRVEYYCTECQTPVCIECKMIGSHSKGPAASHTLISIKQAYQDAIDAASKEDPIFTKRRQEIKGKIESADRKLEVIIQNEKDTEQEIMRLAQAAIDRARQLAGEKALIVRSTKQELLRKDGELDSLSKFLAMQKKYTGPLAFLSAYDRHSMIVANMQGTEDLPSELQVEGDLCVYGKLDVVPSSDKPARNQTFRESLSGINRRESLSPQNQSQQQSMQSQTQQQQYQPVPTPSPRPAPISKHDSPPKRKQAPRVPIYEEEEEDYPEDASISSASFEISPQKRTIRDIPPPPASQPPPPIKKSPKTPVRPQPEPASLIEMARKKEAKNKAKGVELTFQPFEGSEIITNPTQGISLYLCFPFKNMPQTHLLFSSVRDGRSIEKMHQMIDNIGITTLLVKKGNFVFGGFAAAKWNSDGKPFGNGTTSFLFSLSLDAYIPYRPLIADACNLYATKDTLTFGKYDLILADDFDNCSATIENSYGVGFEPGSTEAQTYLAGSPTFSADIVEVWGFFTLDQ